MLAFEWQLRSEFGRRFKAAQPQRRHIWPWTKYGIPTFPSVTSRIRYVPSCEFGARLKNFPSQMQDSPDILQIEKIEPEYSIVLGTNSWRNGVIVRSGLTLMRPEEPRGNWENP